MAKSELKLLEHGVFQGELVAEVWHEDILVATVYGADGPGVRVMTKYPLDVVRGGLGPDVNVIEVRIEPS